MVPPKAERTHWGNAAPFGNVGEVRLDSFLLQGKVGQGSIWWLTCLKCCVKDEDIKDKEAHQNVCQSYLFRHFQGNCLFCIGTIQFKMLWTRLCLYWESSPFTRSTTIICLFSGKVLTASAGTHPQSREWEAMLEMLSALISSQHSAARCLCNGEEPLHVSKDITAGEDNWGRMVMWVDCTRLSCVSPAGWWDPAIDGDWVKAGLWFNCGRAAVI